MPSAKSPIYHDCEQRIDLNGERRCVCTGCDFSMLIDENSFLAVQLAHKKTLGLSMTTTRKCGVCGTYWTCTPEEYERGLARQAAPDWWIACPDCKSK